MLVIVKFNLINYSGFYLWIESMVELYFAIAKSVIPLVNQRDLVIVNEKVSSSFYSKFPFDWLESGINISVQAAVQTVTAIPIWCHTSQEWLIVTHGSSKSGEAGGVGICRDFLTTKCRTTGMLTYVSGSVYFSDAVKSPWYTHLLNKK